jgi:para-nitrobenzyl esterase
MIHMQSVRIWQLRKADAFGPHCMQGRAYDDIVFRRKGMSEDCLRLTIWAPSRSSRNEEL